MILKLIQPSNDSTLVDELPEPDMVVDPRPLVHPWYELFEWKISVEGTKLTITKITKGPQRFFKGWGDFLLFRVYDRNEHRYSFESTTYLYNGLKLERAPLNTAEVVFKEGLQRVMDNAFLRCTDLREITIPRSIRRLDCRAFYGCSKLQSIYLSPNLESIGSNVFYDCTSLQSMYIPPTVNAIGCHAFLFCTSLRIINFPDSVDHIGCNIVMRCDELITDDMRELCRDKLLNWLKNRYNPFHDLCWTPSVTAQDITEYIQGHDKNEETAKTKDKPQFTPLHLLVANPSVSGELIRAYLELAPEVATMKDNRGQTPLHLLCSAPCMTNSSGGAIRAYLEQEQGKMAGFMKDDQGRTPFEYLCQKGYGDMPFLENKCFGGLMVWWFDCLDISLFAENFFELPGPSRKRKSSAISRRRISLFSEMGPQ